MTMNEGFEAYSASRSMRVMGPHERPWFAPDAWGYLINLNRSGVINTVELEHVIERALLQVEGRISLNEIRGLLSESGIEGDDAATPPTFH